MAGTVLAMTGKDSVCIATDLLMSEGMVEVAQNVKKVGGSYMQSYLSWIKSESLFQVHKLTDKVFVGLTGLFTDCSTVLEKLIHEKDLYELRENRKLKPKLSTLMLPLMII